MAGQQRCHQRRQGREISGEVHIQIRQDRGLGGTPSIPKGPSASLNLEAPISNVWHTVGKVGSNNGCSVSAGVVSDGNLPRH